MPVVVDAVIVDRLVVVDVGVAVELVVEPVVELVVELVVALVVELVADVAVELVDDVAVLVDDVAVLVVEAQQSSPVMMSPGNRKPAVVIGAMRNLTEDKPSTSRLTSTV